MNKKEWAWLIGYVVMISVVFSGLAFIYGLGVGLSKNPEIVEIKTTSPITFQQTATTTKVCPGEIRFLQLEEDIYNYAALLENCIDLGEGVSRKLKTCEDVRDKNIEEKVDIYNQLKQCQR